jgi:hypothetical protein
MDAVIAVDTPRGLMVPVIRDAERLEVEGLAVAIADLAGRTRDGRISPDELAAARSRSPTPAAVERCSTHRSSTRRRRGSSASAPSWNV